MTLGACCASRSVQSLAPQCSLCRFNSRTLSPRKPLRHCSSASMSSIVSIRVIKGLLDDLPGDAPAGRAGLRPCPATGAVADSSAAPLRLSSAKVSERGSTLAKRACRGRNARTFHLTSHSSHPTAHHPATARASPTRLDRPDLVTEAARDLGRRLCLDDLHRVRLLLAEALHQPVRGGGCHMCVITLNYNRIGITHTCSHVPPSP